MNIKCGCLHCYSSLWTLECKPDDKPYVTTIDCFCGATNAFWISYPHGEKPTIIKSRLIQRSEFVCSECLEVFEKDWTDEEALQAYRDCTGDKDATAEDTECCCEDCWNKLIVPQLN